MNEHRREPHRRSGYQDDSAFTNTEKLVDELDHDVEPEQLLEKDRTDFKLMYVIVKFYRWFNNLSFITRWITIWFPLAGALVIPLAVGVSPYPNAKLGGVRIFWIFVWLEVAWGGFWVSRVIARLLPYILYPLMGILPFTMYKYTVILTALEMPLAIFFCSIICVCTFSPIMIGKGNFTSTTVTTTTSATATPTASASSNAVESVFVTKTAASVPSWIKVITKILGAAVVTSIVLLLEKIFLHFIGFHYHEVQYQYRITDNKRNTAVLAKLLTAALDAPYHDSPRVRRQDYLLGLIDTRSMSESKGSGNGKLRKVKKISKNAKRIFSKTRNAISTAFTDMLGKHAKDLTPEQEFILETIRSKKKCLALARKIWYSLVPEGEDCFQKEDLIGLIPDDEINDIFHILDNDYSRTVTLDEMEQFTREISIEFRSISSSLRDVDLALGKLDRVGLGIVGIIAVLTFISFLDTSFATILAAFGTTLLSLSFVFSTSAQELMSSIIFLFSKHPFDISDVVIVNNIKYEVVSLSLLFTVFRTMGGSTVQAPNSLLNTLFIENLRRSQPQSETITIVSPFATDFKQLERLRDLLLTFVKENERDFRPIIDLNVSDFSTLDSLKFTVTYYYKSNWQNVSLQCVRRNKFMCALKNAIATTNLPAVADPVRGSPDYPFVIEQYNLERPEYSKTASRPQFSDISSTASSNSLSNKPGFAHSESRNYHTHDEDNSSDDNHKREDRGHLPAQYLRQSVATWQIPNLISAIEAYDSQNESSQENATYTVVESNGNANGDNTATNSQGATDNGQTTTNTTQNNVDNTQSTTDNTQANTDNMQVAIDYSQNMDGQIQY